MAHIHRVTEKEKPYSVVPNNTMSPAIYERGMAPRRIFAQLADILRDGDTDWSSSRGGLPPRIARICPRPKHRPRE